MPQPIEYSIDRDAGTVHRHTQTIGFWGLGLVQSQRVLLQLSDERHLPLEGAHAIAQTSRELIRATLGQFPTELAASENRLATTIGRGLTKYGSIDASWEECIRRLERGIPKLPVKLTHLLANIRRFEGQLAEAAVELPNASHDPTRHWNVESVV